MSTREDRQRARMLSRWAGRLAAKRLSSLDEEIELFRASDTVISAVEHARAWGEGWETERRGRPLWVVDPASE